MAGTLKQNPSFLAELGSSSFLGIVRLSIAVLELHSQKQLGEERVNYILHLHGYIIKGRVDGELKAGA